jgi:hypothetical protein
LWPLSRLVTKDGHRVHRKEVLRIAAGRKVQVARKVLAVLVQVAAGHPSPIRSSKHSMRIATEKSRLRRSPTQQLL